MVKDNLDIYIPTILIDKHPLVWINKNSMSDIQSKQQSIYVIKKSVPKLNNETPITYEEMNSKPVLTGIHDEVPKNIVNDLNEDSFIQLISTVDLCDKKFSQPRSVECWSIRSKIKILDAPKLTNISLSVKHIKVLKKSKEIKGSIVVASIDGTGQEELLPFSIPFDWSEKVKRSSYLQADVLDWNIQTLRDESGTLEICIEGFILWRKRKYYFNPIPNSYNYSKFNLTQTQSSTKTINSPTANKVIEIQNKEVTTQSIAPIVSLLPSHHFNQVKEVNQILDQSVAEVHQIKNYSVIENHQIEDYSVAEDRPGTLADSTEFLPEKEETNIQEKSKIHYPIQLWVHPFCKLIRNLPPSYKLSTIFSNGNKISVIQLINLNDKTGELLFTSINSQLLMITCSEIDGISFSPIIEADK